MKHVVQQMSAKSYRKSLPLPFPLFIMSGDEDNGWVMAGDSDGDGCDDSRLVIMIMMRAGDDDDGWSMEHW